MATGIYIRSEEQLRKLKLGGFRGRCHSEKTRRKISLSKKGVHNYKLSERQFGDKNAFWKGGVSKNMAHYVRLRRLRIEQNGGSHTVEDWTQLKEEFQNMCLCCKRQEPEVEIVRDHIIPISKGGSNNIENIQPLCRDCNAIKNVKETDYRFVN